MLKVASRVELPWMSGPKPAPAAPPAPAAAPGGMELAHVALVAAAGRLSEAAEQLADATRMAQKGKTLEAVVQRDEQGRMKKVIINVI